MGYRATTAADEIHSGMKTNPDFYSSEGRPLSQLQMFLSVQVM
jgi:hypothetical protein